MTKRLIRSYVRPFGVLHWCYERLAWVPDCIHYDYSRTKRRGCQFKARHDA